MNKETGKFEGDSTTKAEYTNDYGYFSRFIDKFFKVADSNYEEDAEETDGQLKKLGLNVTSNTLLASRYVTASTYATNFYVRYVNSYGKIGSFQLCYVDPIGNMGTKSISEGFRPVFLLSSSVKIVGGDGKEENEYELGI